MWGGELIQRLTRVRQILIDRDESLEKTRALQIITQGASFLPDDFPTWYSGGDKRKYGRENQKIYSPDGWEFALQKIGGKRGTVTRVLNNHGPEFPTFGTIRKAGGTFESNPSFENQKWAILVFGAIANSKYRIRL